MSARGRSIATVVLAAGALALAGCGHAAQSGGVPPVSGIADSAPLTTGWPSAPPSGSSGSSSAPSPSTFPGAVRVLNEQDNGKIIMIHRGDLVVVHLGNTYWRFAGAAGPALHMVGEPVVSKSPPFDPGKPCVPGQGCGTVTANFQSVATGTGVVSANRSSCGEARGCPPGQGSYAVTVIVH